MTVTIKEKLRLRAATVEEFFGTALQDKGIPPQLLEAMEYSLKAGGKRLRPVLCLSFAMMHGAASIDIRSFACAFEFIHTYSLIHDDLPAMDDDDLRRGKPSNHKMFGEAVAILAGDALLTEAFALMAKTSAFIPSKSILKAMIEATKAAGAAGMVGGQTIDMGFTAREGVSLPELRDMHARKTGALITAPCVCGAILAQASTEDIRRAREYGREIGIAFQIVDDILDVVGNEADLGKPVGSDEAQGKSTYPALLGIEESKRLAEERIATALESLSPYRGEHADFLRELAAYIVERVN